MMESLEETQARHRKEQRDLQNRITNKKKNATKKMRKGINDECAELERQLKERQEEELRKHSGWGGDAAQDDTQPKQEAEEATQQNEVNGITEQLKDTALSESPSDTPTSAGPKKRNRQKERLARRAAEQEAAAVAAEAEAANMVDHRKVEKTYMLQEFKAYSLVEKEIQPDGHCMFSAVADQLEQHSIPLGAAPDAEPQALPYKVVRRAAAEHMSSHPDDFAPFLEEPLEDYVEKIHNTAEWGGQLELLALANTYKVEIHVVQDGRTEVIQPQSAGEEAADVKKIWLAYYRHGYGLGEHYNSLRKAP